MTDHELQLNLAKMLPEKIIKDEYGNICWIQLYEGTKGIGDIIKDTEWLYVCWLVEQLIPKSTRTWGEYFCLLTNITDGAILDASWQQRAEALCKVKGMT